MYIVTKFIYITYIKVIDEISQAWSSIKSELSLWFMELMDN